MRLMEHFKNQIFSAFHAVVNKSSGNFCLAQRVQKVVNVKLAGIYKGNIQKLSFIVEVFVELRFPDWQEEFHF